MWAPLDPHDVGSGLRRPFRKGKTYSASDAIASAAEAEAAFEKFPLEAEKENSAASSGIVSSGPLQVAMWVPGALGTGDGASRAGF